MEWLYLLFGLLLILGTGFFVAVEFALVALDQPPYFAARMVLSDLGTKGGLVTDADARVLREDGSVYIGGCKMPKKYVAEMFCDRIAACRVYQKEQYTDASPWNYYQRAKDLKHTDASRFMHEDTAALLERWLELLKDKGEEEAFALIRRELQDDTY